jgi:hypothetical protein
VIDGAQQRGFTGPRPAEQDAELAAAEADRRPPQRHYPAGICHGDVVETENGVGNSFLRARDRHALPFVIQLLAGLRSAIRLRQRHDGGISSA